MELTSEIDSLKNKMYAQQQKASEENHAHISRINALCDQLHRESEGYHARAKDFANKIRGLES